MCADCGLIRGIRRRPPLDIHVLPRALRDDGGVDVVPALQLSHRVGKPRPIISVLGGGSMRWRWSWSFLFSGHAPILSGWRHWRDAAATMPGRDRR
jgi:hypothetical protein